MFQYESRDSVFFFPSQNAFIFWHQKKAWDNIPGDATVKNHTHMYTFNIYTSPVYCGDCGPSSIKL